jgi:hypothetical protein
MYACIGCQSDLCIDLGKTNKRNQKKGQIFGNNTCSHSMHAGIRTITFNGGYYFEEYKYKV